MRFGARALAVAITMATGAAAGPIASGVPWQVPDEAIGARLSPILLLSRPDVRAELALSGEQAEASDRAIADLHAKAAALRGGSGPEAVAARRAIDEAAERWIEANLSDEQRARLAQLDLQWEGASALVSRPTIAASLELSEEQRGRIVEAIARGATPGESPMQAHRRRLRDSVAALTEEQRMRWLAMVGRPFDPGTGG